MADPSRHILHVLNYGYPAIDGYTVRSIGLLTAQRQTLGYRVTAATSPMAPLTRARDEALTTEAWGPHNQIRATRYHDDGKAHELASWERPMMNLGAADARPVSPRAAEHRPPP